MIKLDSIVPLYRNLRTKDRISMNPVRSKHRGFKAVSVFAIDKLVVGCLLLAPNVQSVILKLHRAIYYLNWKSSGEAFASSRMMQVSSISSSIFISIFSFETRCWISSSLR